ncbi:MAG TPA: 3-oxoacyl-[acyl-carrier-protein] reductase [Gemmatimonadales bacterium]|nr:3-oxoacyl-[acyl-carrier-protein] reductase [Gemmatimonadales bacterium]
MSDLGGHTALVTGGSRGIGRAIAAALHAAGAKVAILGRDEARAQEAASTLGEGALAVACDVADPASAAAAVKAVEDGLGTVDILVNNAGLTRDGLLLRMGEDDWDAVLDTNLKGAFTLTKLVARGMMKRRWGRIVNVTSVVGLTGNAGQANYAASKAGLIGFTKSVAKELASRNILVNAVAPGFIDTDMTRALTDDQRDALQKQIPLGRLGSAEDVARTVLFLASDSADYITGQVLVVDGGMVM